MVCHQIKRLYFQFGRDKNKKTGVNIEYLFEPSPKQILAEILPRLLQVKIYQAVLESDASEHSARMVAMKNASDNALEIIDDLTLQFNKQRKSQITSELLDNITASSPCDAVSISTALLTAATSTWSEESSMIKGASSSALTPPGTLSF